jgi:hypothetical protein
MTRSSNRVRLQVLLRPAWRTDERRARVAATLQALGCDVTGSGAASISARVPPEAFRTLFGTAPPDPDEALAGRPLTVPAALADSVAAITVAPQHERMVERPAARAGEPDDEDTT